MGSPKTVLITGCSSGIGLETSALLAQRGWRVFATLRDMKRSAPLKARVQGLSVEVFHMDVDKASSVRRTMALVLKKSGGLDALVNNAGWGAFGAFKGLKEWFIRSIYCLSRSILEKIGAFLQKS